MAKEKKKLIQTLNDTNKKITSKYESPEQFWLALVQFVLVLIALAILYNKSVTGAAQMDSFWCLLTISVIYIILLHFTFCRKLWLRALIATLVAVYHLLVVVITKNRFSPISETAIIWCCIALLVFWQYGYQETVRIYPCALFMLAGLAIYIPFLSCSFDAQDFLSLDWITRGDVAFIQSTYFSKTTIADGLFCGTGFLLAVSSVLNNAFSERLKHNENKNKDRLFHDRRMGILTNRFRSRVYFWCVVIAEFILFILAWIMIIKEKEGSARYLLLNFQSIGTLLAGMGVYSYYHIFQNDSILDVENKYIKRFSPRILEGLTEEGANNVSDTCKIQINEETEDLIQIVSHVFCAQSTIDSRNRRLHSYKELVCPLYLEKKTNWCSSRLLLFLIAKMHSITSNNALFEQTQKDEIERRFSSELADHFLHDTPDSPPHSPVFLLLKDVFQIFRENSGKWAIANQNCWNSTVENLLFWDYLCEKTCQDTIDLSNCAFNSFCTSSIQSKNEEIIKEIVFFPYNAVSHLKKRWENQFTIIDQDNRFKDENSCIAFAFLLKLKVIKQKGQTQFKNRFKNHHGFLSITDSLVEYVQNKRTSNEQEDLIVIADKLNTDVALNICRITSFLGRVIPKRAQKTEGKNEIRTAMNEIVKWCL